MIWYLPRFRQNYTMLYLHLTCDCVWNYCFGSTKPPHQLSIIGILILHKSKPANIIKQRLCLEVECLNDNKRFYRAEKIWEKKRGRQLDWSCKAVCGVCCTESATRVPLECTGKVLCTVVHCCTAEGRCRCASSCLIWTSSKSFRKIWENAKKCE